MQHHCNWEQLGTYGTLVEHTHTRAHAHAQTKKHMSFLSYFVFTHNLSLSCTYTPHVYPITGAPRPGLQDEKPNLFIPIGIIGRGWGVAVG